MPMCGRSVTDGVKSQDQFARFGAGDPGPVVDAANAEVADHEVVPSAA